MGRSDSKKTILFFGASPEKLARLKLEEEVRDIREKLYAAEYRDAFTFETRHAVTPYDLPDSLLREKPTVVQISGHGFGTEGIALHGKDGTAQFVSTEALHRLFSALPDNLRVIVLSACYSEEQAQVLRDVVDVVVGIEGEITDEACRVFSAEFYRALGFGRTIHTAFKLGLYAIGVENESDVHRVRLWHRPDVDPSTITLVGPDSPDVAALSVVPFGSVPSVSVEPAREGSGSRSDRSDERPVSAAGGEARDVQAGEERAFEELIKVFQDRDLAMLLLAKAGFPAPRRPAFTTSLLFWSQVAREANNGVLPGGMRPVLKAAAEMYPSNLVFTQYHRSRSSNGPPQEENQTPSKAKSQYAIPAQKPQPASGEGSMRTRVRWVATVIAAFVLAFGAVYALGVFDEPSGASSEPSLPKASIFEQGNGILITTSQDASGGTKRIFEELHGELSKCAAQYVRWQKVPNALTDAGKRREWAQGSGTSVIVHLEEEEQARISLLGEVAARLDMDELPSIRIPPNGDSRAVVVHILDALREFRENEDCKIPPLSEVSIDNIGLPWLVLAELIRRQGIILHTEAAGRAELESLAARCSIEAVDGAHEGFFCAMVHFLLASSTRDCHQARNGYALVVAYGPDRVKTMARLAALLKEAKCLTEDHRPEEAAERYRELVVTNASHPCRRFQIWLEAEPLLHDGNFAPGSSRDKLQKKFEGLDLARECEQDQFVSIQLSNLARRYEYRDWTSAATYYWMAWEVGKREVFLHNWAESRLNLIGKPGIDRDSVIDEVVTELEKQETRINEDPIDQALVTAYLLWIADSSPGNRHAERIEDLYRRVDQDQMPLPKGAASSLVSQACPDGRSPCSYDILSTKKEKPPRESDLRGSLAPLPSK